MDINRDILDDMAKAALTGLLAERDTSPEDITLADTASMAYAIAEEMLIAREAKLTEIEGRPEPPVITRLSVLQTLLQEWQAVGYREGSLASASGGYSIPRTFLHSDVASWLMGLIESASAPF